MALLFMSTLMVLAGFIGSVEFYVVCVVAAAAVVAAAVRPSQRGPVVTRMLASELQTGAPACTPHLRVSVLDDLTVVIERHGVDGVGPDGAVSAAVDINGFDITVKERLVAGHEPAITPVTAIFHLDFLGSERYHLRYDSEATGLMAVASLPVKPGVRLSIELRR